MKRSHGTGRLYVKWGSYYGRWRTADGRYLNRRIGKARARGTKDGITRSEAERAMRQIMDAEATRRAPDVVQQVKTVDEVADLLRQRLTIEGSRRSYLENCESMQRNHISPVLGQRDVDSVDRQDIERLVVSMLGRGLAPKTVRNVASFLHATFSLAEENGWLISNPVARAARPRRRRGDASPDLQFLTVEELDSVIEAIPDHAVTRRPGPPRGARQRPVPPPPADVLGPVLRVIVLAAAVTGLRQSELIGLRWRDVDWGSQGIRVRNAYVRGEHSSEGKSDLSTRRSVPMTDRLMDELECWRGRTVFDRADDLVFAHPELGTPLDRTKVTRRFQAACRAAGVRVIRKAYKS